MDALSSPNLKLGSVESKRAEIKAFFLDAYTTYESLFDTLNDDQAFYQRPEKLRHPLIFYFGHTATFFVNKLMLAKAITNRVNPRFESLFAIGVDEMSWDDLNENNYDWPSVEEVRAYRDEVKEMVLTLIDTIEFSLPIDWHSPMWPILMGIEHERIHLETSSVLIRQLDLRYVDKSAKWPICPQQGGGITPFALIDVPEGQISRDKTKQNAQYGWDNEYGSHTANVDGFSASNQVISNGEFLQFVEQGGYQNPTYWEPEGNQWRIYTNAQHPVFWRQKVTGYVYRAMLEEVSLPLDWPVDVNYHEAKAYCNFLSVQTGDIYRLPTEDEWFRLKDVAELQGEHSNVNPNIALSKFASSEPVNINKTGEFYDVTGNVWQWTETPIYPFNGFEVHPLYDDFTTPTFDNQHNLIKGGSWISTGNEANQDSRYAFRKHFFQHAGFRVVKSNKKLNVTDYNYESDTQVSQYCGFHYLDNRIGVPNFAKASADFCISVINERPTGKALDLGCAVGRTSFELARVFSHVDGIDFSARFVKTACTMKEQQQARFTLIEEGDLTSFHTVSLSSLDLVHTAEKVHFAQGDAANLKPQFTGYDLIYMGNLIDRVPHPAQVLRSVLERLNKGGLLVVSSPFTWLEEYTPKSAWLGGFKDSTGETLTSSQALIQLLKDTATLVHEVTEIPFVIRETARKHQHTFSQFHVFEKK